MHDGTFSYYEDKSFVCDRPQIKLYGQKKGTHYYRKTLWDNILILEIDGEDYPVLIVEDFFDFQHVFEYQFIYRFQNIT